MRKFFIFLIIVIILDLALIGYFFFRFENEKKTIIQNLTYNLVYDFGYTLGLFSRDKILSESFPENVRNYLNELVRKDENLNLILIADSTGKVIFSTNVAYENKPINDIFSENITDLVEYEIKSKDNLIILNMPISEFNKKLLYIRIEYKRR